VDQVGLVVQAVQVDQAGLVVQAVQVVDQKQFMCLINMAIMYLINMAII